MRFMLILALLLAGPALCQAHDLGIIKAELAEIEPQNYRLRVQAKASIQYTFSAPEIPPDCTMQTAPQGRKSLATIDYEFSCKRALLAEDQLKLNWNHEGVMLLNRLAGGNERRIFFPRKGNSIPISMANLNIGSGNFLQTAKRYFLFGGEHISQGYDHLLFVFCLLLLVSNVWMLVKTVTAFTIAHSISLGLSTLGIVSMPLPATEASIALSITFLAAEIIRHHRSGQQTLSVRHPWVVALAFGLLHGLGFASALSELGMPEDEIIPALLFFNLGVEAGQLFFILLVLAIATTGRRLVNIQTKPAAIALGGIIGIVSAYWFIQRSCLIFPF